MKNYRKKLKGDDLRSIGKSNELAGEVQSQAEFDKLFELLHDVERAVRMKAADAIEKISARNPAYLLIHKKELLVMAARAQDKELKWHIPLMIPRLELTSQELGAIWPLLVKWAADRKESRIVRVNSIQALYELMQESKGLEREFHQIVEEIRRENIPSLDARIRKLNL